MTLLEQLAHHLQRPVNEDVRTRARLHLLDWLACVAGARNGHDVKAKVGGTTILHMASGHG